jgi:hypothetical protein
MEHVNYSRPSTDFWGRIAFASKPMSNGFASKVRQCCKTFRCRVALPFPVATIRAPYGFVVASLLIVLVCFSRGPRVARETRGATEHPHSAAPFWASFLSPLTKAHERRPVVSLSGRSVRLAANLAALYLSPNKGRNVRLRKLNPGFMQTFAHRPTGTLIPSLASARPRIAKSRISLTRQRNDR